MFLNSAATGLVEQRKWLIRAADGAPTDLSALSARAFAATREEGNGETRLSLAYTELDGRPVAFMLTFPDVNDALATIRGKLFPFGWIHILRDRQTTDWVNINGLGLLPKYRGLGANAMLYAELAQTVNDHGFKHADLVQVNEANFNSRSDQETLGAVWYKRHRHYKLDLT